MEFCTLQIIMRVDGTKKRGATYGELRMRLILTALLLAVSFPGHAQEGYAGRGHDRWHHGFYNTLQRPDAKGSCCNLSDCRPTSGRMLDGHYEVKVDGAWIFVPQTKIIRKSAPDSGYHV